MKNNSTLSELLSAVMHHPDCPEKLADAILTTTVEHFENRTRSYSPEWFERMIFGDKSGSKNIKITIS